MRFVLLLAAVILISVPGMSRKLPDKDKLARYWQIIFEEIPEMETLVERKSKYSSERRREEPDAERIMKALVNGEKTFEETMHSLNKFCSTSYMMYGPMMHWFYARSKSVGNADAQKFISNCLKAISEAHDRGVEGEEAIPMFESIVNNYVALPESAKVDLRTQFKEFFKIMERSEIKNLDGFLYYG